MMYFLTESLTRQEYYTRLKLRTEVTAKAKFEVNNNDNRVYQDLRTQHLKVLPDEKEYIIEITDNGRLLTQSLPPKLIKSIFKNKYAEYVEQGVYYVGILYTHQNKNYIVAISATDPVGKQDLIRLRTILLFSFLITSVLSLIIGNWFSNQFVKPITNMIAKVQNISAYNLDLRLDPQKKGKGELADLAKTFNNMLDRLETAFQIQNNFVSNASHELRTPLTAILGVTELALLKPNQENVESLEIINKQASRLNNIINGLLKLAQSGYNSKKQLNDSIRIDELVLSILDDLKLTNPESKIHLDFSDLPEKADYLTIMGTEPLLRLAINNIIQNACKYSDNQIVNVKLFLINGKICLKTSDKGIGIPKKDLEHIFELFFRASNHGDRMGFGLGLPLSYRILKVHQATLEIVSEESKGTDVYVYFNNFYA
ncbi:sensor histidine kinase [Pedobacter alpinus]|uniref:histidine kinase n=1 Tax=Pedobacter alpinus TaxID=1590643 RepID=A0ABW5TQ37_9SPHI